MKGGGKKGFRIKKKPVVASKPTVALVKAVAKKVVADSLEDKYETRLMLSTGQPRYFDTPITAVYPLLPEINQGVNSNERVGDKIRPKRMRVDFTITAVGESDSSLDVLVRLLVLEDKQIKGTLDLLPLAPSGTPPTGGQPGTPIGTDLLQYGSQVQGYQGLLTDDMARVNTERYTVIKDIRRELIKGMGQSPTNANSFLGTQAFISGQQTYKVSVVIPTPAVLRYSKEMDGFPTNFAPFFVVGYVQPDGLAAPTSLTQRIAVNYITHLDYEDA